jgi:ferredoxin
MRISVDREICASAGTCVFTAPDVFDQDDEGIVVVLQTEPPTEAEARARKAVDHCPSGALTLVED